MTRNTTCPESLAGLTLERLPQVRARTGLSRSEIYRRISTFQFPAPVKIGERASAWNSSEIDAWIVTKIAARDSAALGAKSPARATAKHGTA